MKNKKLMLIATAAMGFVALGAAGVGTAAWFKVDSAASTISSYTADTESLSTKAGSIALGSFRVIAVTGHATNVEEATSHTSTFTPQTAA